MKIKIMALMLTLVMCLGATACGGSNGPVFQDETKTYVNFKFDDSGFGRNWGETMKLRFNEKFKSETGIAEGKEGIEVALMVGKGYGDLRQDTAMVIEKNNPLSGREMEALGYGLSLPDEWIKEPNPFDSEGKSIEERIPEDARYYYQDSQGHYIQLPFAEFSANLSFSKNTFDQFGLYFAHVYSDGSYVSGEESAEAIGFTSSITNKTFYFVDPADSFDENAGAFGKGVDDKNDKMLRTCGPDGIFGSTDDGMPSSIVELVVLCEYMVDNGIAPFIVTGQHDQYQNFLPLALWDALMGAQGNAATFLLDSSEIEYNYEGGEVNNGKIEIVTGFYNEPLFEGPECPSTILKPKTEWVELTEANGFYITWTAAKYYAEAFAQLASNMGWYSTLSNDNHTQQDAMTDFIFSGFGTKQHIGMLVECTFWYQEATSANLPKAWETQYNDPLGNSKREIYPMELPRTFDRTVTEGEGNPMGASDGWLGAMWFNINIAGDAEKMAALKTFVQWWWSDVEMANFTKESNLIRQMNYTIPQEILNSMPLYTQRNWDVYRQSPEKCVVSYYTNSNPTTASNPAMYLKGYAVAQFGDNGHGAQSLKERFEDPKSPKYAYALFQSSEQMYTRENWKAMYKGAGGVQAVENAPGPDFETKD